MSAQIQLRIKDGKTFTFTDHDTFIFGRMDDCHACIADDTEVSRHHFILEVNPPQACLRDLGSLNGTYVKPVSDVWSTAATMYNLLTGAFPYPFTKERGPIDVILHEQIIPLRQRDSTLPAPLAAVLEKALAVKTKDRYQTAGEMLAAMKRAL